MTTVHVWFEPIARAFGPARDWMQPGYYYDSEEAGALSPEGPFTTADSAIADAIEYEGGPVEVERGTRPPRYAESPRA